MAEEDILREIGSISRALDSIANIEFKDLELNRGQYLYLTRVFEHPGIISDHLAILIVQRLPVELENLNERDLFLKKMMKLIRKSNIYL